MVAKEGKQAMLENTGFQTRSFFCDGCIVPQAEALSNGDLREYQEWSGVKKIISIGVEIKG